MSAQLRNFALWVIIVLLLLALFTLFQNPASRPAAPDIPYSQFINEVEQGRVREVTIQGSEINGAFIDGRRFQTYAPNDPSLLPRLIGKGVIVNAHAQQSEMPWFVSLLLSWLPFIVLIGVWIFLSRQMHQASIAANRPSTEVEALRRQIEDLRREIDRLKDGNKPTA